MIRGVIPAAGVVLALATACSHYTPAPLVPADSAAQFAQRRLDDPALAQAVHRRSPARPAPWPPARWDRAVLLVVALERNPPLRVARAEAQAVAAHEVTAGEWPNPAVNLQSEYAGHDIEYGLHDVHPWLYGIGLEWPLPTPTRRQLQVKMARIDTSRARATLLDATWTVRRELIEALSAAEATRRRTALLARLAAAQERMLEAERARVQAGEDPPGELLSAERARIEIEQRSLAERAQGERARAQLVRVLGTPGEALAGIDVDWGDWGAPPPVAPALLAERREQALLSRPDLLAALEDYARSEAQLELAVARQYPTLSIEPGYYWDHGIAKLPLGLNLELPLNGNRGEITESRAARDLAGERMLALQADIDGEIAAAQRAEQSAREAVGIAEQRLEVARRQAQHGALGLTLGAADRLEQTAVEVLALQAELEVLELRAQWQAARNALEDALRSPLSGPELDLASPPEAS